MALVLSCSEPEVPGGKIKIRNDILDTEFNSFVVDEVMQAGAATGFRKTIRPGEEIILPFKHITSLRFTRQYKDLSRVYVVDCPEDFNKSITMKLIDVHSNRVAGGCTLVKRGEMIGGAMHWEK